MLIIHANPLTFDRVVFIAEHIVTKPNNQTIAITLYENLDIEDFHRNLLVVILIY